MVIHWNLLRNKIHALAKDKGWWDFERPEIEALSLVVCEVAEAIEEYRNPDRFGRVGYGYEDVDGKPEGVCIELVDAAIRLLDFCGRKNIDLDAAARGQERLNTQLRQDGSLFGLMVAASDACFCDFAGSSHEDLAPVYLSLLELLREFVERSSGLDFMWLLSKKYAYNAGRPHRHGGKRA